MREKVGENGPGNQETKSIWIPCVTTQNVEIEPRAWRYLLIKYLIELKQTRIEAVEPSNIWVIFAKTITRSAGFVIRPIELRLPGQIIYVFLPPGKI